eukprot:jgi/Psemu1/198282/e_gw1.216.45.1
MPFCFVLGDTTVNSCCPDEVAALHLNADVLVHYGHACLSPTGTLPVLYSFGKSEFDDLDGAVAQLQAARTERSKEGISNNNKFLVLYQVGYHHAMKPLQEQWMNQDDDNTLQVVTAEIPALSRKHNQRPKTSRSSTFSTKATDCCQSDDSAIDNSGGNCCGDSSGLLCFLSLPHGEPQGGYWIYSPKNNTLRTDVSPPPAVRRLLKRRFFLTQKARDANVFGILVSNLSQQHLVDVVKSLQRIIQDADRTAYSFAVGKINPAKLANFAEIETFVMVACREHSLLDQEREYPIPVITPMELEIALENLQWGMQAYSLDCQDVMLRNDTAEENADTNDNDDDDLNDDSDAPYFSMITGRYESRKSKKSSNDLDLKALPGQEVTEYKSEAANFLKQREYQGLESKVGQTEAKAAVLGMRGIASDYDK